MKTGNHGLHLSAIGFRFCFILHPSSLVLFALLLSACGTTARRGAEAPTVDRSPAAASTPAPTAGAARPAPSRSGGYYLDDGPGDNPPPNLDAIPDAVPKAEPLARAANRPYEVMGVSYVPEASVKPYKARGLASWYGRRYHGKRTSSGEPYDMYAMTAAHTTLAIPSYARVTNVKNGRTVVVRINDRGPFHSDRIIDVSYTAAYKLGILGGVTEVEVESVLPGSAPPVVVAAAPVAQDAVRPPAPAPRECAAPPPEKPAADARPVAASASGIFLQLGAFSSQDNADAFLARMRAQLDWLASSLSVLARDGLYRVHAGPYPSRGEAQAAADRIGQTLGIKPLLLAR